ncbi:MAG: SpoVG family protein [Clostridiales bacterium]|nr:SpoVG family protein [Clostridiales bacterium]
MNENNQMNTPEVTAKITWMNNDPNMSKKAAATITIGNCFAVHGLSVVEGPKGLFVSMPQRASERKGETKYFEVAHPTNAAFRQAIVKSVMDAYNQAQVLSQQYKGNNSGQNAPMTPPPLLEEDGTLPFSLTDEPSEPDSVPIMGQTM